jgi:methionine-rich copper-binding protein CopC
VTVRARLGLVVAVAALLGAAFVPGAAQAHATLEATTPARGADLTAHGRSVSLRSLCGTRPPGRRRSGISGRSRCSSR